MQGEPLAAASLGGYNLSAILIWEEPGIHRLRLEMLPVRRPYTRPLSPTHLSSIHLNSFFQSFVPEW